MRKARFLVLAFMLTGAGAFADEQDEATRAKEAFRAGASFVEKSEWADALTAFERSSTIREHALTLYNVGVCQRYLGMYTKARQTLRHALKRHASTGEMPETFVGEAKGYLDDIEHKLGHVHINVDPKEAVLSVDGRPIAQEEAELVAGIATPGLGASLMRSELDVVVDPGGHIFSFVMSGYSAIEVRRDVLPGARQSFDVSMREQPATLRIASDVERAAVRVNDVDIGMTPVTLSRPPGSYALVVSKPGYVDYQSKLVLKPGQEGSLRATLPIAKEPLTKKWWFWTLAGAVATGIGLTTYFLVRPQPGREPVNLGGLGWAAEVK